MFKHAECDNRCLFQSELPPGEVHYLTVPASEFDEFKDYHDIKSD